MGHPLLTGLNTSGHTSSTEYTSGGASRFSRPQVSGYPGSPSYAHRAIPCSPAYPHRGISVHPQHVPWHPAPV